MPATTHGPRRRPPCARGWRHRCRRAAGLLVAVALTGPASLALADTPPTFEDLRPAVSHDGAFQLTWSDTHREYQVELRRGERARVIYRGTMPSAHVSGLVDGDYELRVRGRDRSVDWTAWSTPFPLRVQHHPMALVWTLMALGLVTFVATAAVVVVRSPRESS